LCVQWTHLPSGPVALWLSWIIQDAASLSSGSTPNPRHRLCQADSPSPLSLLLGSVMDSCPTCRKVRPLYCLALFCLGCQTHSLWSPLPLRAGCPGGAAAYLCSLAHTSPPISVRVRCYCRTPSNSQNSQHPAPNMKASARGPRTWQVLLY
jgi:hypothetical protein